jgi:hypothetical protein
MQQVWLVAPISVGFSLLEESYENVSVRVELLCLNKHYWGGDIHIISVPDRIGPELNRECLSPPLLLDGFFELGSIRSAHHLTQIQGVWIGSGLWQDRVHLQLLQKQIFLIKLWVYCFVLGEIVDDSFSQLLLGFGEPLGWSSGAPGSSSDNDL